MTSLRTFRARVGIYSPEGQRLFECGCLLEVEVAPFMRSMWRGYLSESPTLAAGRYRMRFPNGRVREVEIGQVEAGGLAFTGLGTLPMP